MSELSGKIVGKLVISSDVVATRDAVQEYVGNVSADLQEAIDNIGKIAVDGYVPLSALSSEVLKIISENYATVANLLDNGQIDNEISVIGGDSSEYA